MSNSILVVEDDRHEALLYEEVLEKQGFTVQVVNDAEAALAAVREKRPDLVVLDINMPGMDGLDVLRELMGIDKKLPVILNTAYAAYQENFTSWSAAAYVVKSADTTELIQTIRNVLAGQVS